MPHISYLVSGGSGGGGNSYTGSSSSNENFTACLQTTTAQSTTRIAAIRAVPEVEKPVEAVQLVPNPANNYVDVYYKAKQSGDSRITMVAMDGRVVTNVYMGKVESEKMYQKRIELGSMAAGMYKVQVVTGEYIELRKLIVTK